MGDQAGHEGRASEQLSTPFLLPRGGKALSHPWDLVPSLRPWPASQVPAVEVCGLLPVELAVGCATVLSGPEALEAVVDELGILLVEVLVGHHIRRARVHLVTAHLRGQSGSQGH